MEDYFVKNTVSLETSACDYSFNIDFSNQQRSLYKYKAQKRSGGQIYAAFFFDLILVFKDQKIEKMTLRIEIFNDEKYLILWKDEHRARIESILLNCAELEIVDILTEDVLHCIDAE